MIANNVVNIVRTLPIYLNSLSSIGGTFIGFLHFNGA